MRSGEKALVRQKARQGAGCAENGDQKMVTETIVRIKHRKGKKGALHGGPDACPRSHIIHDIIN